MTRAPASVSEGAPPSSDDLAESSRLYELARSTLDRVRNSADQWRNGLGVASLVAGGLSVFVGLEAVRTLEPQYLGWLAAAFLVSVVSALISIGSALRASSGWPSKLRLRSNDSLRRWEAKEARTAVFSLRVSVVAAFIALVGAAVVVGLVVFAPVREDTIAVVKTDGRIVCGQSIEPSNDGIFVRGNGPSVYVANTDYVKIIEAADCD